MRCVFNIVFIALLLGSAVSYSQGIPMHYITSTPYGNVSHTSFGSLPYHPYGQVNISGKYEFYITLKNDSTFSFKTLIDHSDKDNHFITIKDKNGKKKLFPVDTKSITRVTLDGERLVGIPTDSCWLFKCERGKINSYSFLAMSGMHNVIAIQDGEDAPIVPLTKENLLAIVGTEDQKVYKFIEKGKLVKAIVAFNATAWK